MQQVADASAAASTITPTRGRRLRQIFRELAAQTARLTE